LRTRTQAKLPSLVSFSLAGFVCPHPLNFTFLVALRLCGFSYRALMALTDSSFQDRRDNRKAKQGSEEGRFQIWLTHINHQKVLI
jgi:hypothetical protein